MMAPACIHGSDPDRAYVAWRIIDCCLREDVRGIVTEGRKASPPFPVLQAWGADSPFTWWHVGHWPAGALWLPIRHSDSMQSIGAISDGWVHQDADGCRLEHGAERWLDLIASGLDQETQALHLNYAEEAACAAQHRAHARRAYIHIAPALLRCLDYDDWAERLLRADQVASHHDHPFYPTARAKSGFDEAALSAYAPEFDPSFDLHWLAIPNEDLTQTTPPPSFWPHMVDLGLPAALESTHSSLPVHPLTWSRLDEFLLPPGTWRAPRPYLRVRPTLSVRSVMPIDHPYHHIKLPLLMRTLGALNLRLIKPSTLYDGHWFQRVLSAIGEADPALRGRFIHVDESHGAHVDDAKHLAYLVRTYPQSLENDTLIPVAALCSQMPDGRSMAVHLADRFHDGDLLAWWREYADLLCDVHLRLWLQYGIALESNQQNAVLICRAGEQARLLMKDNDAARALMPRLASRLTAIDSYGPLRDERIAVEDDIALARMFCTITLQLCLTAVLDGLSTSDQVLRDAMYQILRDTLHAVLHKLDTENVDTRPARTLLGATRLPVKYLLSAGSLLSKRATGAADINKFYGDSGPNFMLAGTARSTEDAAVLPAEAVA